MGSGSSSSSVCLYIYLGGCQLARPGRQQKPAIEFRRPTRPHLLPIEFIKTHITQSRVKGCVATGRRQLAPFRWPPIFRFIWFKRVKKNRTSTREGEHCNCLIAAEVNNGARIGRGAHPRQLPYGTPTGFRCFLFATFFFCFPRLVAQVLLLYLLVSL